MTKRKPDNSTPLLPRRSHFALKGALVLGIFILCACFLEYAARKMMKDDQKIARKILLGRENVNEKRMQNTIGQPYLLYISAPGYISATDGPQINEDGYRGEPVPFDKDPNVLRILCLGGSTTYSSTVPRPDQAYPAVLEHIIHNNLPEKYTDVEVMNAGLPWATSSELLTHYLFKYRYYRPDIVIINTGGNDAEGYTLPYYHPDSSNWRQPMVNLRPLPSKWRWLARSRFVCTFILEIFYQDQMHGGQFVIRNGAKPRAAWFRPHGELVQKPQEIPLENLSFYRNIQTLIRAIQADGGKVMLVPFRAAPDGYRQGTFELSQIERHEQILKDFAKNEKTAYAPFPASIISPGNWTDRCHLNADGTAQKAEHIAQYLIEALN
ncbi:MAG: hypothetical protein EOM20_01620 [Spartobacteria bacterium]|nr:hypothetical protein [Spartobacteria bacterium]